MGIGWKTPTKTAFLVVADEDIKDIGFFLLAAQEICTICTNAMKISSSEAKERGNAVECECVKWKNEPNKNNDDEYNTGEKAHSYLCFMCWFFRATENEFFSTWSLFCGQLFSKRMLMFIISILYIFDVCSVAMFFIGIEICTNSSLWHHIWCCSFHFFLLLWNVNWTEWDGGLQSFHSYCE